MSDTKRFPESPSIDEEIANLVPINTKKSQDSCWRQFENFLEEKGYALKADIPVSQLALIMKDFGFNMRKKDGTDYKEGVVKTIWNTVAKMLQKKYYTEYNIIFDPFQQTEFECARKARDAKRKQLQKIPEKRKQSSGIFTQAEFEKIVETFDETTPEGLQKKFFHIAAYELAWRGGEAANCLISFFDEELDNLGQPTGRIIYNPVFSKTHQGGGRLLAENKWLVQNTRHPDRCPVRLFKKLKESRGNHITTKRLFLAVNPNWSKSPLGFFKNCPVGRNELSKWTKLAAEHIGLNVKKIKFTNHSNRSSVVSHLAKSGIGEHQITKITGHSNIASLKSYMQVDGEHHKFIIEKMREATSSSELINREEKNTVNKGGADDNSKCSKITFLNCTFNQTSFS